MTSRCSTWLSLVTFEYDRKNSDTKATCIIFTKPFQAYFCVHRPTQFLLMFSLMETWAIVLDSANGIHDP